MKKKLYLKNLLIIILLLAFSIYFGNETLSIENFIILKTNHSLLVFSFVSSASLLCLLEHKFLALIFIIILFTFGAIAVLFSLGHPDNYICWYYY